MIYVISRLLDNLHKGHSDLDYLFKNGIGTDYASYTIKTSRLTFSEIRQRRIIDLKHFNLKDIYLTFK